MRELDEAAGKERRRIVGPEAQPTAPEHQGHAAERAVAGRGLDAAGVLRLQRLAGNRAMRAQLQVQRESPPEEASPVHDAIGRTGSPVDSSMRSIMEPVLGTSLSGVQVVPDRASTSSVAASAFTVGEKVVVNPDHFQSGTPQAQRTLAHELTHVKQQREGPVEGTPQAGGIKVSHPQDRFEQEAERTADAVMSMQRESLDQLAARAGGHALGDGHDGEVHEPGEQGKGQLLS